MSPGFIIKAVMNNNHKSVVFEVLFQHKEYYCTYNKENYNVL